MDLHADGTSFEEWLTRVGYEESRTVEKLMEHVFLAEVLQECWFVRRQIVEVLRAEVDASGYDLVLGANGRTRYVQLKASKHGGKTARQTINSRLKDRDGGCVVWVTYEVDPETWRTTLRYRWWDGDLSELPATVGRNPHTKKVRPKTVVLKKSDFEHVATTAELVDRLFGPA